MDGKDLIRVRCEGRKYKATTSQVPALPRVSRRVRGTSIVQYGSEDAD